MCCHSRFCLLVAKVLGIVSLVIQVSPALAETPTSTIEQFTSINQFDKVQPSDQAFDQVTSVNQLIDVQPSDWAFQALQSLVERYGCITGYQDNTYKGNRGLTRYEFAAALNSCLDKVNELIAGGTVNLVRQEDLATLQKLQTEFTGELTTLRGQVDKLEAKATELETNQFSTTTKLTGQVIFALNSGAFSGDRIISPTGATIATENPNTSLIYRASVDLNTSFTGTDLLKIRLITGSGAADDNAAGFLEPNFGSVLDFSVPGRNDQLSIGRLYYAFNPTRDLRVTFGSALVATEYVDKNSYANISFKDFSTQALINNFVLFPRPGGSGAVVEWNPRQGPWKFRGVYIAASAARRNEDEQRVIGGPSAPIALFPNQGGRGGLFADPYQGIVEVEYSPSKAFALRLQYAAGEIFQSEFNGFGINFEAAISKNWAVFGRYGLSTYNNTFQGDLTPNYWMAGIAFRDLFIPGAQAGIAVGQPYIESKIGNATQTNMEAFYNFPVNNNITVTPLMQVIVNPGNQSDNNIILTGTLRTVFSF
jgi:hypothetical protein